MSKGSNSYNVCKFYNRLRNEIEDLRASGGITPELEGKLCLMLSEVKNNLDFKNPEKRASFKKLTDIYDKKLEDKLNKSSFNLKEVAGTFNVFINQELARFEARRIKLKEAKGNDKLTNRALDRIRIRLNECTATLLVTCDDVTEIIDCENDSDLEFLLMNSEKAQ